MRTAIKWPLSVPSHNPGPFGNQHQQIDTMSHPPSKRSPIAQGTRGVGTPAGDMYADKRLRRRYTLK